MLRVVLIALLILQGATAHARAIGGAIVVSGGGGAVSSVNGQTGAVVLSPVGIGAAPAASPSLTGVPTAPTSGSCSSTTQIATQAYVGTCAASTGGVTTFNSRSGAVALLAADLTGVGGLLASTAASTYMPLSGGTFSGQIAGPTPAGNDNSTNLATTAWVQTYVGTNPGAYAALLSPALTGTPTAPSPSLGDNSTKLATTAFVDAYVASNPGSYITASQAPVQTVNGVAPASGNISLLPSSIGAAALSDLSAATSGVASLSRSGGTNVLTSAQYRVAILAVSGALTSNDTEVVPASWQGDVENLTTGAYTVSVSIGSGTVCAVPQGTTAHVDADGTNVSCALPLPLVGPGTTTSGDVAHTSTISIDPNGRVTALSSNPIAPSGIGALPAGVASISTTGGSTTLSSSQFSVGLQSIAGALTSNAVLTEPNSGEWLVENNTSGAFTVKFTTASGSGVTVPQGSAAVIGADGTNVVMFATDVKYAVYYTVAGAIGLADGRSIVTNATSGTTIAMTIASDTQDGRCHNVKKLGAGTVTLAGTFDGASSPPLTFNTPAQIKESVRLCWNVAISSYTVE